MTYTPPAATLSIDQMRRGPFVPGRNADPDALAVKRSHLWDDHVALLNNLADAVAASEDLTPGLVPYVDPQLGGINASVLALLDNPSTKAEAGTGSGLLSLENDDPTARNCAALYNEFGLEPELVVHWNVAPAPIVGKKNGRSSPAERERGAQWLKQLVDLLPNLQVVLLMGDMARDGWRRSSLSRAGVLIPSTVPHPSNRGLNNPGGRERLRHALAVTKSVIDGRTPAPAPSPPVRKAATANASSETWAWWPTFEHYSSPNSNPWGISSQLQVIEKAMDQHQGRPGKWCVIARRTTSGWTLVSKRANSHTEELQARQIRAYDGARAGGSRGNLGQIPPASELTYRTRDLDS